MPGLLPPHFIELVFDAALKSFWTRRALQAFLRRNHVSEQFLATWSPEELEQRLNDLGKQMGSQEAGYEFQTWFFDLMDYFEVISRRPYVAEKRQIDGSVTIEGTTYLVELKFTREQAAATDIDIFLKK